MHLAIGKRGLVAAVYGLVLFFAVILGVKSYELWPQVTFIWEFRSNPIDEFNRGNPHALRYAVVYPILTISEYLNIAHDSLFSFAVIGSYVWTFRNMCQILRVIGHDVRNNFFWLSFVAGILLALFLLMNGRASFAFLGYSMLLTAMTNFHFGLKPTFFFPIIVLVSITLCGVTSGTLFSALGAFLVFLYFEVRKIFRSRKVSAKIYHVLLAMIAVFWTLLDQVVSLFEKNFQFFGGGIDAMILMLGHGAGAIFKPVVNSIDASFLLVFLILAAAIVFVLINSNRNRFILGISAMAVGLGAFGFTAFALAALPISLIAVVYLRSRVKFR